MRYEIDTDALQRDIDELDSLLRELRGQLSSLDASMQSLNQTWEGLAKEAYLLEYQKDMINMEALCSTIQELIRLFTYAQEEYQKCSNTVQAKVDQLQI